jgi:3-phosphoshikimate 1-carboxyvinyltransferase
MNKPILIQNIIKRFNKKINMSADKSLSIRIAILASLATGRSKAYNLLKSEDVMNTLKCLKKLGVKIKLNEKYCSIDGRGLNSYVFKDNLTIDAGNSGTAARLICSTLIKSPKKIKIIGDKSLSNRDMKRVIDPLKKFGANFYPKNKITLPFYVSGTKNIRPINYKELRGSAQCKSAVMLAALSARGTTKLKCKPSRNHTELLFKYLKIPIKITKKKGFDYIEVKGGENFNSFNYTLPGDISSSAFFIVLTLLSKKSILLIRNINVNPTRTGVIDILNLMGAKIKLKNKKTYKGERIADIFVEGSQNLKAINCPTNLNSGAIDEFLIIFLVAAKANGISYFKKIGELNQKESRRLEWGSKILNMMGVKTKLTNESIKIYGQPNLVLNKKYHIKNYLKDHRIFMMCTIAALTLGGKWKINDPDSIKTSFPSFLSIIKNIGGKLN